MKHVTIKSFMELRILIYLPLPPHYFREIWDYKNANIECVQKAIYNFDWTRAFQN